MHSLPGIPSSPTFIALKDKAATLSKSLYADIGTLTQRIGQLGIDKLQKEGIITGESADKIKSLIIANYQNPIFQKRIENLKAASADVTPKVKQIPVQHQMSDGTDSGFENCGYHSLKNALVTFNALFSSPYLNQASTAKSFTYPQLFMNFYLSYALPLLADKEVGQKDASDPMLREMIGLFLEDPKPHPSLLPLQKTLKNNLQKLGIYSLLPSDNTSGLQLTVMSVEALQDILQLYKFAKNKGPSILICPVTDICSMHWVTITLIKSAEGTVSYLGCDSFNINQSGMESPLGKICNFFEETLANPNEFIETALSSFIEEYGHYANRLQPNGLPDSEESEASLLELADDPVNLPWICFFALEVMRELNWNDTSDPKKYMQFFKFANLANFYNKL